MRPSPLSLLLLIVLAASGAYAQGLRNGWHEDTKTGFKIKMPEKWECVPIAVEEQWIVAKYLADRAVAVKKSDFHEERKPQMRVIVFSDEARKFRPATAKEEEHKDGRVLSVKSAEVPYKDYKDYMKRNGQEGGFYFDKEKETKIGDVPCTQYEIKFEKLTEPRHAVTWVFRGDAADYAVEFEVLEDHWVKFQPVFLASLQSFKFIKREAANVGSSGVTTGGGDTGGAGDPTGGKKRDDWKQLSAKERADRRKSTEESRFQRAKEKLPQGWTVKTTPHFLVISHTEQKYTDKVVDAAESCRNWLDKTLGGVSDEYAMKAIIRVCASYDEYKMFHQGSDDAWDMNSREIVTFKDANMGSRRSGFDRVFSGMLFQYLRDKDPLISSYSPDWATMGLLEAIRAALPEGGTLKLGPDEWEADILRTAKATKMAAKEVMEASMEKLFQSPTGMVLAGRLARYFLAQKKDFMVNYFKAVIEVAAEFDKSSGRPQEEAKTEEEEEARMKARREDGKKRSTEVVQKVHEKVCKWGDKEWASLDNAFQAFK